MTIATWNVNGLWARLDFVGHRLDARRPDLVGIQELKLIDRDYRKQKDGLIASDHAPVIAEPE